MSGRGTGGRDTAPNERERILSAFVELVAERGYAEVDRLSVTERAGLGRRAFERHFPDRRACFDAAWDQLEEAYMERAVRAFEAPSDWRQRIRATANETVRLVEAHPARARFMTVETLAAGSHGRERQRRLATRLAALVDRVRTEIDGSEALSPVTAEWVVGAFFYSVNRSLAAGSEAQLADRLPQLMYLAVCVYQGPEAAAAELRKRS